MKAELDRIKSVLATKDFGTHLNHYLFEPGWVLASDGRMVAAVPTTYDFACLVPGPELEAVVNRFSDEITVAYSETTPVEGAPSSAKGYLKIQSGRLRGAIETLPVDQVQFFRPEGAWLTPPEGLVAALKRARPFIAETAVQSWALCACLHNGAVVATNNMSIIRADCPELTPEAEVLLPSWAVDFILKHSEPLTGVMWNTQYAAFQWESGLWFWTKLIDGKFPPQIAEILAAPERAVVPVEKEWLHEYCAVAELSENIITIACDLIEGGRGKARVHAEIQSTLASMVIFNPKFLTPVLQIADFWGPDIYPAPVPFRGDGFSGVAVGRKA